MLTAVSSTRAGLRPANGLSFGKLKVQTKFCERVFSYSEPTAWNSLPYDLQSFTDTNSFKRRLSTDLFAVANNAVFSFGFYRRRSITNIVISAGLLCKWSQILCIGDVQLLQ